MHSRPTLALAAPKRARRPVLLALLLALALENRAMAQAAPVEQSDDTHDAARGLVSDIERIVSAQES